MAIDQRKFTSALRMMSDEQLQQTAQMHQNDPYIFPLAFQESQERKALRSGMMAEDKGGGTPPPIKDQALMAMAPQAASDMGAQPLPESVGIGALPMQSNTYAGGGIVAFAGGGKSSVGSYEEQIRAEAVRQGVDPDLMVRMFATESEGNPNAVSPKGAAGLGQLMIPAAKEMGLSPEDRFNPSKNIPASVGYFKKQLVAFGGDQEKAAAAYNWGPGAMRKHLASNPKDWKLGLPKETANYLTKLMPVGTAQAADTYPAAAAPAAEEDSLESLREGAKTAYQVPRAIVQNTGAKVLGGLAGIAGAALPGKEGQGADWAKKVESYLGGYTPSTKDSQRLMEVLGKPAKLLEEGVAAPAGTYLAEEGYPATGAIVKGGIEALPAALGLRLPKFKGSKPAAAPAEAPVTTAAPVAAPAVVPEYVPRPVSAQQMAAGRGAPPLVGPPMPNPAQVAAQLVGPPKATAAQRAAAATPAAATAAPSAARAVPAGLAAIASRAGEITGKTARAAGPVSAGMATTSAGGEEVPTAQWDKQITDRDFADKDNAPPPDITKKEAIAAAKSTMTPEERKESGFSAEDWLTLGFALLSGKSPSALQNLGEAGAAMLAGKTARTKAGLEALKTKQEIELSKAHQKYYGSAAERMEEENKPLAQMRKELAAIDAELQKNMLLGMDPLELARVKKERYAAIAQRYPDLAGTMGLGTAAGVVVPQGVTVTRTG